MTKIYLVRHCEALGNIRRVFQGHTDLDISELGNEQLSALSKRFENIKIDKVYTSPLLRARKTAQAIIGSKTLKAEIDEGLIELNAGIFENNPFEMMNEFPDIADAWNFHPQDFNPPEGESMKDAYKRIWNTVKKIAKNNNGKTVACATHGGVMRCINCRLIKNDINELKNIDWAGNTAVSLVEFDDELNYTVRIYNDISHLPENLINKKSQIVSAVTGGKI